MWTPDSAAVKKHPKTAIMLLPCGLPPAALTQTAHSKKLYDKTLLLPHLLQQHFIRLSNCRQ